MGLDRTLREYRTACRVARQDQLAPRTVENRKREIAEDSLQHILAALVPGFQQDVGIRPGRIVAKADHPRQLGAVVEPDIGNCDPAVAFDGYRLAQPVEGRSERNEVTLF